MAERSGVGDQLDRTARQVRQGAAVHELKDDDFDPERGRWYWTRCGGMLLKEQGAVLTTEPAKCEACRG